jgi:hypothetical protein
MPAPVTTTGRQVAVYACPNGHRRLDSGRGGRCPECGRVLDIAEWVDESEAAGLPVHPALAELSEAPDPKLPPHLATTPSAELDTPQAVEENTRKGSR